MAIKNHRDLLLISVDSPIMLGIYENKKLVKSFSAEGKFSDSLPKLFAEIFFSAESSTDSANRAKNAESSDKIKSKKPIKSFCYFWLLPKVESPLPLNPNLPNSADSANRRISNIYYANGPGNFSAIKLTHIFLQTLSITKNIPLFCADAFHFSDNEFINAYGKVHFYKKDGAIHTTTLDSKRVNSFALPQRLDSSIFSADCAPLYILPAV